MSVSAPNRVPAGVPTGGRFAPGSTGESPVALSCEPVARCRYGGLTDDELLDCCRRSGEYWGRRYRVDAENLASETMLRFLERVTDRNEPTGPDGGCAAGDVPAGERVVGVAHPRKYIDQVARSIGQRQATGLEGGRNIKSLKLYLAERDRQLAANGYRALTPEQEDRIAEQVRASMPPGARPVPDFHRASSQASREAAVDFADPDAVPWAHNAGPLWRHPGRGSEFAPGSPGEQAEAHLGEGRAGRLAARRMAWDAISHGTGGPGVCHESLGEDAAAAARRTVREAGGPAQVARNAHEYGYDDPRVAALMSPFGPDATTGDVLDVARVLARHPGRAEDLWDAAVFAATRRRAGRQELA